MPNAVRFVRAMDKGWTLPHLFECDDGNQYVVKFMSNPKGRRGLAKELIAYRLGRMLDLPVVKGTIVYLSEEMIELYPNLKKQRVRPGPHFGSLYLANVEFPSRQAIGKCVNLYEAAGMIVFDTWLKNKDRHSGNILITKGSKPKFKLIDHQCIFGSYYLDRNDLRHDRDRVKAYWNKTYSKFVTYIDQKDNPFRDAIKRVEDCTRSEIESVMRDIPEEWGIHAEESKLIVDYLYSRKRFVRDAIYKLKPYFPEWDGK